MRRRSIGLALSPPRSLATSQLALLLLALSMALCSLGAQAAILEVDCVAGPFFDIDPAVTAAGAGDTILVRPCASAPYGFFRIENKEGLHIIGRSLPSRDPVPQPDFRPSVVVSAALPEVVCVRILNSTDITLRGFTFEDCRFHSIETSGSTDLRIVGNRFERGGEEAIRDGSTGSQYIGNVVTDSGFSFFLDGHSTLVARNLVFDNVIGGIEIVGTKIHIVDNRIVRNNSGCIGDQGDESRLEGNVCLGNSHRNGVAEISLRSGSTNADVIGNVTGDSISDFSDTGADLADNR